MMLILQHAKVDKSQSVLFGSVGAALAVGATAVVGIVFVVVVAVKWRKKNKNGIPTGILSTINMTRVTKQWSSSNFKHYVQQDV